MEGAPSPSTDRPLAILTVDCLTRCVLSQSSGKSGSSLVCDWLGVLRQVADPLWGLVFDMEARISAVLVVVHLPFVNECPGTFPQAVPRGTAGTPSSGY